MVQIRNLSQGGIGSSINHVIRPQPPKLQPVNPVVNPIAQQMSVAQPVTQTAQPIQQQLLPQSGLVGSEQALRAGMGAGVSALEQAQRGALDSLNQGARQVGGLLAGAGQNIGQAAMQASDLLGGDFSARAAKVDPTTGQPLFQQAAAGVGAFSPAGLQAQRLQSALSGAQGQEAFDQALLNSPIQNFLRQQGEQSIINQAAATGGLGGGEVQRRLAEFGQGLAGTQLQQQINNLANLSSQGLQAAGQQGQFLSQAGQQQGNLAAQNAQMATQTALQNAANRLGAAGQRAGILTGAAGQQANLAGQGANLLSGLAGQRANVQTGLGQQAANLFSGTGSQIASGRQQAGRDIASQIAQTTGALSNLQNLQGSGLSDIVGQGATNVANLLSGAGQLTAGQQQQLAAILANIATGTGSQLASAQQAIGKAQSTGTLGAANAFGGTIGDIAGGLGSGGLQKGLSFLGGLF